ncbi:MAG: hypothetical protein Q9164_006927 [Protoblastenia rupestris]
MNILNQATISTRNLGKRTPDTSGKSKELHKTSVAGITSARMETVRAAEQRKLASYLLRSEDDVQETKADLGSDTESVGRRGKDVEAPKERDYEEERFQLPEVDVLKMLGMWEYRGLL